MLMVVEYVHSFDGFPDLNGLHGCDCLMRDGLLEATVFYDGTSTPFDPPGSTKLVSVWGDEELMYPILLQQAFVVTSKV